MKKLLTIILVLILVLTLSGCGEEEQTLENVYYSSEFEDRIMYGCSDIYGDVTICKDYIMVYTQEEVDEMLLELDARISNRNYELTKILIKNLEIKFNQLDDNIDDVDFRFLEHYTEDELDLMFDEIVLYVLALEARIEELENE